jgi:hypothetical protein
VPSKFWFNNGIFHDLGLTSSFSRAVATIAPDGAARSSNQPRFDTPQLLAGAAALEVFDENVPSSLLLASGYDHDGDTQLMVVHVPSIEKLHVYYDPPNTTKHTTDLHLTPVVAPGVGGVNCLFLGSPSADLVAYNPRAATVCHGLIGLWCTVIQRANTSEAWNITGSALLVSQDQGQSWDLVFDDLANPRQKGLDRGARWSLQCYFTPGFAGGRLEVAWLVATNYCIPPSLDIADIEPIGGRVFVCRITRPALDPPSPPGLWEFADHEGRNHIRFDMQEELDDDYVLSRHAHSGGLVPYGSSNGVRLVVSLGDQQYRNRFVTAVFNHNPASTDWTDRANWTFSDAYHGRGQVAVLPEFDWGVQSCQPVGILQSRPLPGEESPDPKVLLWGADESGDALSFMDCEDGSKPIMGHLYGSESHGVPAASWMNAFVFATLAPEQLGPVIIGVGTELPNSGRVWFQPADSEEGTQGLWATIAIYRPVSGWIVPWGNHCILGNNTGFMMRRPLPGVDEDTGLRVMRPILVSPGVTNLLCAGFFSTIPDPTDHVFERLERSDGGQWFDRDSEDEPVFRDPQPPVMTDAGFKVRVAISSNPLIATLRIAEDDGGTNRPGWHTGAGPQDRFLRCWVLDASTGKVADLPRPSTANFAMQMRGANRSRGLYSSNTRWMPHTVTWPAVMLSDGPLIDLFASDVVGVTSESYFYLAFDQALDDPPCFSYPSRVGTPPTRPTPPPMKCWPSPGSTLTAISPSASRECSAGMTGTRLSRVTTPSSP